MTFETLLENLENGVSNVYTHSTDQAWKVADERVEGKETGRKIVRATGGRVVRKIAENALLQGVQGLFVRKGVTKFGNDAVIMIADSSDDLNTLQTDLIGSGIEPRFLSAIVKRFLKQLDVEMILTDMQNLQVIGAVCRCEVASAKSVKFATDSDRQTAQASADAYNAKQAETAKSAVASLTK